MRACGFGGREKDRLTHPHKRQVLIFNPGRDQSLHLQVRTHSACAGLRLQRRLFIWELVYVCPEKKLRVGIIQ